MTYPHLYFVSRKTTDPSKVKTSKKHRHIWVKPLEPPIADPAADEITTDMMKGHAFDPTDVRVYEFFIQGAPNPKYLEDVEEDQLLDICHAAGMDESPKVTLDIQCLWQGGGAALTSMIN